MDENTNNNMLGEVLGALINNRDGNTTFGGNWIWVIFLFFMMCWGGNGLGGFGFGNRGFFSPGTNIATQGDVAAATAWGQTQDAIRDSIENTTNNVGRLAQDVSRINDNMNQLGYAQLAQDNNTNQQIARTGFDIQTAILGGNNLLQGAIMGGNNLLNSAIRETAGDTKLTFCQGNSALQAIIQGTANQTQRDICNSTHSITDAIYQTSNNTQRDIQGVGFGLQTTLLQTSNTTQREIAQAGADNRLGICQATNAVQSAINENGNRINSTISNTGNNIIQGITGLGFLTQQKGDELKFELSKATCAITTNETANTQKVLDKLCQMESNMQATRINELQIANQALMLSNQVKDLQAGQIASNGFLINALRPYPVPAYTVSSPYGTTTTTTTPTTGA